MVLEIVYQTQNIPAPFAYEALFKIDLSLDVQVSFELNYLDRDELTDDEIINEGFSLNDDFLWNGNLGSNWRPLLLSRFKNFNYQNKPSENFYIYVLIDGKEKGFLALENNLLLQELMQGVFESSGKEDALTLRFYENDIETTVTWKFSLRELLVNNILTNWTHGNTLMQEVYSSNLEELKSYLKPKNKSVSTNLVDWLPLERPQVWKALKALLDITKNNLTFFI
ncbi:MAG: hypothetical protein AAF620_03020 [Bacteroidota bacterium]